MQTVAPETVAPVESVAVAVMRNPFGDLFKKIVAGFATTITRPTEAFVVISTLVRELFPTASVATTVRRFTPSRSEMFTA